MSNHGNGHIDRDKCLEPVGSVRPKLSTDAKLLSVESRLNQGAASLLCQAQGFPKPVAR